MYTIIINTLLRFNYDIRLVGCANFCFFYLCIFLMAFPEKSKENVQSEINLLWSEIKTKSKDYEEELKKL